MKTPKKEFTHYLTPETSSKLKKIAYVSGISQSALIEEALNLLFKTPTQTKNLEQSI